MPSSVDRTAGEIDWPPWAERTPADERERTYKFGVSLARALNDIETVLEKRIDVDDWRLSTAAPHRKKDGRPYADANPVDPSVVVRWTKDGDQFAVACDRYEDLRDNVRSIGLYLEEKRKMSIRPVTPDAVSSHLPNSRLARRSPTRSCRRRRPTRSSTSVPTQAPKSSGRRSAQRPRRPIQTAVGRRTG